MSGIRAVVFDVGRVLVQWDLRALFGQLIDDPAELDWFCANVVTEQWHFQHDAGRDLAEMVAERKSEFPAHAAHLDAYATRFNDTVPGPVPGTQELVEQLAARGVPLYAITNFGAEFWEQFVPEWPVFRHFRDIIVSGREKLVKPDAAIYRLAEQRFGYSGAEIMFIDDNAANIAAARAMGWHGHLFQSAKDLERDLIAHDLLER